MRLKIVEKIQKRKITFIFFQEKNKNISKKLVWKLKIRPEVKLSRKNKSVIFFQNILSESKNRAKTRSKWGFGLLKAKDASRVNLYIKQVDLGCGETSKDLS